MPTLYKYHEYKVYRGTTYLGDIPNVTNPFEYSQDINTAGTQITVNSGTSVDTSGQSPSYLTAEDGTILTAEDGTILTTERADDIFGNSNDKILFRNGNKLQVWEFSNYWPNGKKVFSGRIKRCEGVFGSNTADEGVNVYAYSDGDDLSNAVLPGGNSLVVDQSQTIVNAANTTAAIEYDGISGIWIRPGQEFVPTQTNLAAITLNLMTSFSQVATLYLYANKNDFIAGIAPMGSASLTIPPSGVFADYQFIFTIPITVVPGKTYFFMLAGGATSSVPANELLVSQNDTGLTYSPGDAWFNISLNPSSWIQTTPVTELYFKTYYSLYTTKRTFSNVDPTAMITAAMPTYNSQGGLITSNVLTSTGLSVSYTFQLATILQLIQTALKLAPATFYWYVDVGLSQLNFKKVSTTADIKLTRKVHIEELKLVSTTENVKNLIYFTGGPTAGVNLFKIYSDAQSILDNGPQLDLPSDNRVTLDATATAIATAELAALKDEQYMTQVTVLDSTMDITFFKPGQTIGFNGFGSFVDALVIQIVRIDYKSDRVVLTLGALPERLSDSIQQIIDDITSLDTIANPNSPS